MRPRASLTAALVLILGVASGAWAAETDDDKPDGRALYKAKCARCHGLAGTAVPEFARSGAVDLNDPDWQKDRSDAQIKKIIADGS